MGTWTVESGPLLLQLCNLSISVNSSKRQIAVLTGLLVIKVIDVFWSFTHRKVRYRSTALRVMGLFMRKDMRRASNRNACIGHKSAKKCLAMHWHENWVHLQAVCGLLMSKVTLDSQGKLTMAVVFPTAITIQTRKHSGWKRCQAAFLPSLLLNARVAMRADLVPQVLTKLALETPGQLSSCHAPQWRAHLQLSENLVDIGSY